MNVKINFIIGQLSDEELETLKNGYSIISKMILTPDDYGLFHYKEGDNIQVETDDGNRLWCAIEHLEVLNNDQGIIIIFTLLKSEKNTS
jgi:hypothetical protein